MPLDLSLGIGPSAWIPNIPHCRRQIIDARHVYWDRWQPLERYRPGIRLIPFPHPERMPMRPADMGTRAGVGAGWFRWFILRQRLPQSSPQAMPDLQ